MCLGFPLVVRSCDGLRARCQRRHEADDGPAEMVDLSLVGTQPPGTWVLVHVGNAVRVLDPQEAEQIADAMAALDVALAGGSVDHLFADLVDREPELPDFLRTAANSH